MRASVNALQAQALMEALEHSGGPSQFAGLLQEYVREPIGAWANLRKLYQLFLGEQFTALLPFLLQQLADAADADRALRNLVHFVERSFNPFGFGGRLLGSPDLLRFLVQVFGFSQFLADILIRNPEYLDWLRGGELLNKPKAIAQYVAELEQAAQLFQEPQRRRDAFCRFQRKELLRIGVRDLFAIGTLSERTAELSDLAEALIGLMARLCQEQLEERYGKPISEEDPRQNSYFGVVAMGKLGGRELNFSSDVDLIFLYSSEGMTTGVNGERQVSNHQFFTRLGEDLINELSRYSEEGFLYRVDMRLRPEGETGHLVRSLLSMEMYYLTQARHWERLAMSKARVIFGSTYIERPFQSLADHFVYGQPAGPEIFTELADLKSRIDDQVALRGMAARDVKRGEGGIREIEFIVGALQLLHGRKYKNLRVRSTLTALTEIDKLQLLPSDECKSLRENYVFLRNVEHRLQMQSMAQTHTLPQEIIPLRQLAMRCGFLGDEATKPEEQFRTTYNSRTAAVHSIFIRLFGQTTNAGAREGATALLNKNISAAERFAVLKPFRFTDQNIVSTFEALAHGHKDFYLSAEGQHLFENILPAFLKECAAAPLPEQAVRMFDAFMMRMKGITAAYTFLRDQPQALRVLLQIFGTSEYLGRILQGHPEFLDILMEQQILQLAPDQSDMQRRALRFVENRSGASLQTSLCRFKEIEYLTAGARWLEKVSSTMATAAVLSDLADACLQAAYLASARELMESEHLDELPRELAVIAMGKLAIREMNFFSDLDLVFAHGAAPPEVKDSSAFFSRWAQRIVSIIAEVTPAGQVFKIDSRLRPEGKNAPLVAPIQRYIDYYNKRAQVWEFQSFVRSRHVAGNDALSTELRQSVLQRMKALPAQCNLPAEIKGMRKRLEDSVRLPSWAHSDFKRSRGGMIDLEFLLQYLQLRGVAQDEKLFTYDFSILLDLLRANSMMTSGQAEGIRHNYSFLRDLESRSRLLFSSASNYMPQKRDRLAPLEFFMREVLPNNTSFMNYTIQIMQENRKLYDALIKD